MGDSTAMDSVSFLRDLMDKVLEKETLTKNIEENRKQAKKLSKDISSTEKSIEDEITGTVKKRKHELISEFDKKTNAVKSEKKDIENRRTKQKNKEVAARVGDETEFLVKENKEIRKDIRRYLRENRVPKACRNQFFNIMYMPVGLVEWLEAFAGVLILFLLCPIIIVLIGQSTGFYNELREANQKAFLIIIIAIWVILVLAVYFIIYANVKMKYIDVFRQIKELRKNILSNEKKINEIKKDVHRDKDESRYNLEGFNKELSLADEKQEAINFDRNNALKEFEDNTIQEITDQIKEKRTPELDKLHAEEKELNEKIAESEKKLEELSMEIVSQGATHVGEDMLTVDKLTDLIDIIESGSAATVSEAVDVLKEKTGAGR